MGAMDIKDRIRGLQRVPIERIRANPKNWRTHPDNQRDALKGMLSEVGFAAPVICRQDADGSLLLIDGHLRVESLPKSYEVPVIVLDVTEDEANKLLATMDPLSALAGQDDAKLVELLSQVDSDSAAVQKMMADLVKLPEEGGTGLNDKEQPPIQEKFQILIECESEAQQTELLETLSAQGVRCRSLIS